MKLSQLLDITLTLINERDSRGNMGDISDYEKNAPALVSSLCNMLWSTDEAIKGHAPDERYFLPVSLKGEGDEIFLHPTLCHNVLPYGLAYLLLLEEDRERAEEFYRLFRENESRLRSQLVRARRERITEEYF